jgi:hypothetical protein
MNRTQKEALGGLLGSLSTLALFAFIFFRIFVLKKPGYGGIPLAIIILILFVGTFVIGLFWTFKRQSPKEPMADERDKLILNRAAKVSLASAALIVLPAVSVIPRLILGDTGCIPAWSLPFINFGALVIVWGIYSAAILLQYISGRGNDKR